LKERKSEKQKAIAFFCFEFEFKEGQVVKLYDSNENKVVDFYFPFEA
jgi:hypothetical protein